MAGNDPHDSYQSSLTARYCTKSPLSKIFSEKNKTQLLRQLWIWLAEAELELGLTQVTQGAIDELKANKSNINWEVIQDYERRYKHDVMAHNKLVSPNAAGIIHLGATSCFVQDNSDLIIIREALDYTLSRLAVCLQRLADFAEKYKEKVTVGRTHYQSASLVTVGKRAVIWAQELLMAFEKLEHFRKNMRFRGTKGATGTQDSFLTLFKGDEGKVERLDRLVAEKAGFEKRFKITGQTYSRQQDSDLYYALSVFGAAACKICTDIRILQSYDEIYEPFEKEQIGSSAMPYKRNPMKCERICGFAVNLMSQHGNGLHTLAHQGFERTLDDSSNRRLVIPNVFYLADAILGTLQNVFEGLHVNDAGIKRNVDQELPFLALEKTLMFLTEQGVSRQEAHEKIREVSLEGQALRSDGKAISFENMLAGSFFDKVREESLRYYADPLNFTGRCRSQVEAFLKEELYPVIEPYLKRITGLNEKVTLDV